MQAGKGGNGGNGGHVDQDQYIKQTGVNDIGTFQSLLPLSAHAGRSFSRTCKTHLCPPLSISMYQARRTAYTTAYNIHSSSSDRSVALSSLPTELNHRQDICAAVRVAEAKQQASANGGAGKSGPIMVRRCQRQGPNN